MSQLFFTNRVNVTPWSAVKGIKRILKNRCHPITLQWAIRIFSGSSCVYCWSKVFIHSQVTAPMCNSRTLHFDKGNNTIKWTAAYHVSLKQQQQHHGMAHYIQHPFTIDVQQWHHTVVGSLPAISEKLSIIIFMTKWYPFGIPNFIGSPFLFSKTDISVSLLSLPSKLCLPSCL